MKLLIALVLALSIQSAHAFDLNTFISDLKVKARPHLVKVLGEEKVNKLLGEEASSIVLPAIPKLEKSSTSVAVYAVKEYQGTVKFKNEELERYNNYFIQELFRAVRRRDANSNEISQWMNVLQQGGTREGVYRGLVLDQTYAGLENYPMPVNDTLVKFTSRFLDVYTGKKYELEKLMGFNFFALKRNVTERALEVLDAMPSQQARADWYAVLSAELAKDYPQAFDNKTRTNTSAEAHQNWANSYSTQYLKSEVIIKLHKIFNSLI
ncbi:MAG: hypothetical protein COW01_06385 [Bdellovibrionales bacterium CG12_big_fil_rev_8_21_14_0_65_38_15]|nr:MAG: hypothetical protein COW79_10465 [Bdellovibrionales bacterium CG22_combo_CG10-13_8_21_14_all_38_13]PIQ55817.1 MAG: hypothetical protein COW01_06385 [Bdellovibrionales bacterium CG12_big_fil_rev_8_21_14_0_65_38_15]PIR28720.1 MAG: hypothetical protein COV38_14365 [Bdellovibrionales bacterium CG11_big_fil_rev_8_21_14_0_20_38_13]